MPFVGNEAGPDLKVVEVAALTHVNLVDQSFCHDHMSDSVDHGDIGAGLQRQMVFGLDVRRLHEIDLTRVNDDQVRAIPQSPLHARCEDGVPVRGVCADDHDDVGLCHGCEVLRAR